MKQQCHAVLKKLATLGTTGMMMTVIVEITADTGVISCTLNLLLKQGRTEAVLHTQCCELLPWTLLARTGGPWMPGCVVGGFRSIPNS